MGEQEQNEVKLPENWNELPEVKDLITKSVTDAVSQQTQGLVSKRDELLGEVKKYKEIAKQHEGIDPEKAREAIQKLQELEDKELLDSNKIDELFQKKTERMVADHEHKVKGLTETVESLKSEVSVYRDKLGEVSIEGGIRDAEMAMDGNIYAYAWVDVFRRAKEVFKINDKGESEPRDPNGNIIYGKDASTPITYQEWLEGLRDTAPHFWEASNKGGSGGHPGDQTGTKTKTLQDQLAEAKKNGDLQLQIRLKRLIAKQREST